MRVIETREYGLDLRATGSEPARAGGKHLSGVIRYLALQNGLLKHRDDEEDLDVMILEAGDQAGNNERLMLVALGIAWEEYRAKRIPGLIHQPGEMCKDGIHMNPDGFTFPVDRPPLLHEFKATWTSARKPIEDHPMWMWQGAGYLAAMSDIFQVQCTRVVFHPVHMRGHYKKDGPQWPLYRPQMIEFEWEEIQNYWGMMVKNREYARPEGNKL